MSLLAIRKGERRHAWAAFLTLFVLIASHSILETARDALFLARVPASRLPWVFLAIAALSYILVKLQSLATSGLRPERALSITTSIAGVVTLAFYGLLPKLGAAGLYALYVWSGVLVTLVLVHFWALASDLFTITQAKRLYGFIGAGSVLGAIVGSGTASLLSRFTAPEHLLVVSAVGFGVAGVVPTVLAVKAPTGRPVDAGPNLMDSIVHVGRDVYAARIAASLFVATVCLTLADYIFKSAVAAMVPERELGQFLGSVYFAANLLSLFCQLAFVGWILRRLSLGAAMAILPALFVVGGLGVVLTGGLTAVLALKATDGAFRYSLHRTAAELLLVPFTDDTRRRVKAFVDVVGQRGGQAFASAAIILFTVAGARPRAMALALAALAVVWVASALSLRKPYIELFRARLKAGQLTHSEEFPGLDVSSLETLLGALESHNDAEVIAALRVLEREEKAHLIPALILYHPSEQVVLRALAILTRSGRKNFVHILDRVIDHPSATVRAAAIAARSVLAPDAVTLHGRLESEESPEVRASIVVNLIASGDFSASERTQHLDAILQDGSPMAKAALADAIGLRRATGFDGVLIALAKSDSLDVRRAAITAMGRVESPTLLPYVVQGLVDDATRSEAERVIASKGTEGFDALVQHFGAEVAAPSLRWRIPPAMALANPERAISVLLEGLPLEKDGKVRFQVIRTLERILRRHPSLPLHRAALDRAIEQTVAVAYLYLDARTVLVRGAEKHDGRKTPGHQLLRDLLSDKEANTKSRLFRLLGLLHPTDDFGQIYRGLSATKERRATSMELLESVLRDPLRMAVLGLVDDGDDRARVARAGRYHRPLGVEYDGLLSLLARGDSDAIREVTRFHAGELGLAELLGGHGQAA